MANAADYDDRAGKSEAGRQALRFIWFFHWGEGVATGSEAAVHVHPAAPHHFAPFITAPGGTDWLMIAVRILLILMVVGIGVFYLKLHALPEHKAHRGQKVEYEIVAVLALIAILRIQALLLPIQTLVLKGH